MAVSLPGTSDNVLTAASLTGYTAFPITLICWTKQSSFSGARMGGIGNSASDNGLMWFRNDSPDRLVARLIAVSSADDAAATTPTTSTWVFSAFKFEGHNVTPDSTNKVFASVGGTAWGSGTASSMLMASGINQAILGRFANNEVTGHGAAEYAHYAVFKSSLSNAALTALAAGANPKDYSPTDYWTLDSTLANEMGGRPSFSYPSSVTYTTGPTINAPAPPATRRPIVMVM